MARIALEVRSLSTLGGGVRTYTTALVPRLIACAPQHEFHVFYDAGRYRGTFPAAREHVVPVGHSALRLAWDTWLLPRALGRLSPDLVHFFKPALSLQRRFPSVVTVYDIIPLLFPDTQTWAQRRYWGVQLPRAIREATHILTISEHAKSDIVEYFHVPPERVTVTLLGVDTAFSPREEMEQARVRTKYRLAHPYLLYVGTIEPRKNVAQLIRAFAHVQDRVPHHLVIAGKWGWRYDDVRRAAADPRVTDRVRFLSYVPTADLPALYSAADAFVFPSRYEGFGLPALEAMACGTPVVTSSVSCLPEAVGPHALLVDPNDEEGLAAAIERLVTDRDLNERLRREGPKWAEQFTWEKTARQTLAVYTQVLS